MRSILYLLQALALHWLYLLVRQPEGQKVDELELMGPETLNDHQEYLIAIAAA